MPAAAAVEQWLASACSGVKATPKNKEYYWQEYEGNPNYAGTPALEDAVARLTRLGLLFSRGPAVRQMRRSR